MRGGAAGRQRERQVADCLRADGWVVVKGTSFGTADLVALRAASTPMLVEVKSTTGGPYEHFRPADRRALALEAGRAGADAVLAWWPPRGKLRLIYSESWPA